MIIKDVIRLTDSPNKFTVKSELDNLKEDCELTKNFKIDDEFFNNLSLSNLGTIKIMGQEVVEITNPWGNKIGKGIKVNNIEMFYMSRWGNFKWKSTLEGNGIVRYKSRKLDLGYSLIYPDGIKIFDDKGIYKGSTKFNKTNVAFYDSADSKTPVGNFKLYFMSDCLSMLAKGLIARAMYERISNSAQHQLTSDIDDVVRIN